MKTTTSTTKNRNRDSDELDELLVALDFKTPPEDVPQDGVTVIREFLKAEQKLRRDHRIARLMNGCGLRASQIRTFETFDWQFNPKLPKEDILAFRGSSWIDEARNLVMIGDTGVGKTHWAKSLCYDAVQKGQSAYFTSAYELIGRLKKSPNPETKVAFFGTNVKVLCIDELGYTQQSKECGDLLFQIIAKRNETLPTIITTNLTPKEWGSVFSGSSASAVLDRMNYNGKFLTMTGPSYRTKQKRK